MTSPSYVYGGAGSWFTPTGGYTPQQTYTNGQGQPNYVSANGAGTSSTGRRRFYGTHGGPVVLPGDWSEEESQQWVAAWNEYIDRKNQELSQTQGIERQQILAQIEDAKRARDNELQIAQLQRDTQRYGYDLQRQTAIDDLKEKRRQFDASHAVEMQRLGLDRAKTATDYLSSGPDRYVAAGDYLNLTSRIAANQSGAGSGSGFTPQQRTMSDYATLEAGGNPDRQVNASTATQAAAGQGAGADARIKALKAVIDAAPPSDSQGMDENSYHVLNAAKALYSIGNLNPQQQATISSDKTYQGMTKSGFNRAGLDYDSWWRRQQASLPGQGSVRSAY